MKRLWPAEKRLTRISRRVLNRVSFPVVMLAVGVTLVGGLLVGEKIGQYETARKPAPDQATITVVETSTMMDAGSTAVGTLANGTKVLLRGDWVAGQAVPAFSVPGPNGTQDTWQGDDPRDAAVMRTAITYAILAGGLLANLFILMFTLVDREKDRERESQRLIDAALSRARFEELAR